MAKECETVEVEAVVRVLREHFERLCGNLRTMATRADLDAGTKARAAGNMERRIAACTAILEIEIARLRCKGRPAE